MKTNFATLMLILLLLIGCNKVDYLDDAIVLQKIVINVSQVALKPLLKTYK